MKNDIYIHNLKNLTSATLFSIPRYTYVPNMGTLSQTMPREWSYLGRLVWNIYMFIDDRPFCEVSVWKVCRKSSLSFILPTNTHNRTPCQGISFFEVFYIFFEFFEKMDQMAGMAIRWKRSIFSKLSTVLWNNHYFCTLKWFLWKFHSKLSHTCRSNWNYFRKIDIKSFKRAKLGRKQENS